MKIYRSMLFVPGSRPDRFDKAAASGADCIIIDLEDAVLPDEKAGAREVAFSWLHQKSGDVTAGVRINSPRTVYGCADVAGLAQSGAVPDFVMVAKTETAIDLEIVDEALNGAHMVMGLIESVRGLENAGLIAAQCGAGVLFGGADFSAELGVALDWEPLLYARSQIVAACAKAGVAAYDVPYLDVKNDQGLQRETERSKALGFTGRACIHPSQVEAVNDVFEPTAQEIETARAVIRALEEADGGAVLHQGKLVDRPVVLAAERVLARARSKGN